MMKEQSKESRVRSLARRRGYSVRKSHEWKHVPHSDNYGDYMLCHVYTNSVVLGVRFNATLDDIEAYLRDA
jgi:hypothetical protein